MSAATENYVEKLQNDLKRAQEAIKQQQDTITALRDDIALHEAQETIPLARLKKQSHICTAGNNGDLPGEMG